MTCTPSDTYCTANNSKASMIEDILQLSRYSIGAWGVCMQDYDVLDVQA